MAKNKKQEQKRIEEQRKKQSRETMSFNRFLLFRYVAAFFFFLNLYWLVLLIQGHQLTLLLPLLLMVAVLPVVWEHFKKLHNSSNELPYSKIYFWIQLGVNFVLLLICMTPLFANFYPFMSVRGKTLIITMLILGILLCLFMERRVNLIEHDRDRYLKTMQEYNDALNKK